MSNPQRPSENHSRSTSSPNSPSIAVIGGSAAGLFTSLLLAGRGLSVRVLERIETLEPEARTLIVTHRMRALLGRAAEGSVLNEIRRFELFTDGRAATITLNDPDLIIERRTLIQGLAAQAQQAGAKIELGRRFRGRIRMAAVSRRGRAHRRRRPRGNSRRHRCRK